MRVAYLPTFALISLCVFLVNKSVEKQKADNYSVPPENNSVSSWIFHHN